MEVLPLRLLLKGGVMTSLPACIRRSSITPPLRGSRREGGARSRAGGGQTPRPVSQYQQYGKQRQSPWWISFVDFFFGRRGPASTPHRISLRLPAQLLRLPLKGGVIINIGKRRQSPSWSFVPLRGYLFSRGPFLLSQAFSAGRGALASEFRIGNHQSQIAVG